MPRKKWKQIKKVISATDPNMQPVYHAEILEQTCENDTIIEDEMACRFKIDEESHEF